MKKRILILLAAAVLTLSGCTMLQKDNQCTKQGMDQIEKQEYEAAVASFEAAIKYDENLIEAYRGEGIAYLGLKDYESAVTAFDKAVDLTSEKDAEVRRDIMKYKATALYENEDYETAVSVCDTILDMGDDVDAYYMRGICNLNLGAADKAKVNFNAAADLEPDDYDLLLNIYQRYDEMNQSAEGDAYLQKALAIETPGKDNSYQRARIYYYLSEYEKAKEVLATLAESKDEQALLLMGQIYMQLDDTAHARQIYQQYMDKYGKTVQAYNGLVLCDLAEKDYDTAVTDISEGLNAKGEEGKEDLYFNEILLYEYRGDFTTAKAKAEIFVANYPNSEEGKREYEFLQSR